MSYLRLTKIERRVIIILMAINSFALFVNEFKLQGEIGNCSRLFTNEGEKFVNSSKYFYPFVELIERDGCFKGMFAYYDSGEFFVYTILIFGVVFIKKVW